MSDTDPSQPVCGMPAAVTVCTLSLHRTVPSGSAQRYRDGRRDAGEARPPGSGADSSDESQLFLCRSVNSERRRWRNAYTQPTLHNIDE